MIGLSDDPARPSHGVADSMRGFGYRILPMNPKLTQWEGLPAYPVARRRGRALGPGERIDIVNVFRRPAQVDAVVDECLRLGLPAPVAAARRDQRGRCIARAGSRHVRHDGPLHLRRPHVHAGVRSESGILRGCDSTSRRCMASATISSCSMRLRQRQSLRLDELRRLSDRRTGIGFDQALVLEPPRRAGTDVYYRIFNADGSEVEQCGNGARCIARLVASRRNEVDRPLRHGQPGRHRRRTVACRWPRGRRHGRARFRACVAAVRCARGRTQLSARDGHAARSNSAPSRSAIRTP